MNETFMKEKPIFPLLLGMGMPMVLSMLVNSLYNIVDSYFVARISENAMEFSIPTLKRIRSGCTPASFNS